VQHGRHHDLLSNTVYDHMSLLDSAYRDMGGAKHSRRQRHAAMLSEIHSLLAWLAIGG